MVIGMSRRDGRRKNKRIGKRKNQIFLVMMTILACMVAIVLIVKMNNQNVSKGVAVGAEYTAIKSDGNVTEEQLSVSEETVNDLPDVYRIECYESLNQNPELPTGCEITSLTSVLDVMLIKQLWQMNILRKAMATSTKCFLVIQGITQVMDACHSQLLMQLINISRLIICQQLQRI